MNECKNPPCGNRAGSEGERIKMAKKPEVLLRKMQRGEITINEARKEMGISPIDMVEFNQLLKTV